MRLNGTLVIGEEVTGATVLGLLVGERVILVGVTVGTKEEGAKVGVRVEVIVGNKVGTELEGAALVGGLVGRELTGVELVGKVVIGVAVGVEFPLVEVGAAVMERIGAADGARVEGFPVGVVVIGRRVGASVVGERVGASVAGELQHKA